MNRQQRNALVVFQGVRHPAGYAVRQVVMYTAGEEPTRRIEVAAVVPVDSSEKPQPYDLPDDVFLKFARVEPTEAGVAAFATSFGLLAGDRRKVWPVEKGGGCTTLVEGELLSQWQFEIAQMNEALERLSVTRTRVREPFVEERLKRFAEPIPTVRVRTTKTKTGWMTINARDFNPEEHTLWPGERLDRRLLRERQFKEPTMWGARDLVELINRHLQAAPLQAVLGDYPPKLMPRVVPRTLLAAMWVQLLERACAAKAFRQCIVCHDWMLAEEQPKRYDRLTCSGRCRQRLHVERRARSVRQKPKRSGGKKGGRMIERLGKKSKATNR